KPAKGIFERALASVGVCAAEALHVGDSLADDYHGAAGAGLQAVLLDRSGRAYNDVVRVRTLGELQFLLSGGAPKHSSPFKGEGENDDADSSPFKGEVR